MKPIANQKIATINKQKVEKGDGKNKPFMYAYVSTLEAAAQELKHNAFKVYMYFISNLDGYRFGISPQDIANRYGMNVDTARDGIAQLIDKGYLVLTSGNEYVFYDTPDRKPIELPDDICGELETKEFVNKRTGEKVVYTFKQLVALADGDEEKARKLWEGA